MYGYEVKIEKDGDGYMAQCVDMPEALTGGDTFEEVAVLANDAVWAAIEGYIRLKKPIPLPAAQPKEKSCVVMVDDQQYAKIVLWNEMVDQEVSKSELARKMGKNEAQIRRLLNFATNITFETLSSAASALGLRVKTSLVMDEMMYQKKAATGKRRFRRLTGSAYKVDAKTGKRTRISPISAKKRPHQKKA